MPSASTSSTSLPMSVSKIKGVGSAGRSAIKVEQTKARLNVTTGIRCLIIGLLPLVHVSVLIRNSQIC